MIDWVTSRLNRRLIEVPGGFKWFVENLIDGAVGFCGEESSGATFLRRDGTVWTTDKDGIVPNLLAGESRRALAVVRGSIIANLLENLATHITNAWTHLRHRLKRRSWENFRLKWSMYQSSPASRSRAS